MDENVFPEEYFRRADESPDGSSWISHLPEGQTLGRVAGLGMNEEELVGNARLTEYVVHDLNRDHELPYAPSSFDRVLISVSIQYLVKPVEVLSSVRSVMRPEGQIAIAMSHR